LQGVGEVVSAGDKVAHMLGKPVAYIQFGAFAEYTVSSPWATGIPKIGT